MPRGGGRGSGGGGGRGRGSGGGGRGSGGGGRGSGGRGQKSGHKGQRRHFTSPEELEAMKEREERERQWRKDRGDESSEEGDDSGKSGSEEESSESEGEKKPEKKEPVAVGDIENPNRVVVKAKKVTDIDLSSDAKPELSRREREELERQKARQNYMKLHAEGKTDEARADLARLAIIKKQREEAAKKREDEKNAREAARIAKTESTNKALGKGRKT